MAEILRVRPQTLGKWRMGGSGLRFVSVNGRSARYRRKSVGTYIRGQNLFKHLLSNVSACVSDLGVGQERLFAPLHFHREKTLPSIA